MWTTYNQFCLINLQQRFREIAMQRKPPYLATEETEDCSSQEYTQTLSINTIQQTTITDVWVDNFHQQINKITHLSKTYTLISIDTEFPSIEEYNEKYFYASNQTDPEKYLRMTKNVDSTQVIQLGLCLSDQYGNVPQKFCWQFNFKYEADIQDISAQSAYLLKKAGIDFDKLRSDGVPYKTFIQQFIKSGLLLNKKNRWVAFHGGYDFLYLLKLIRNQPSPKSIQEFYKSIKIYFPQKVDLKLLIQKQKRLKRFGLGKLSETILCRRIGPQHQGGSDALLTLQCYFKLRHEFQHLFENLFEIENLVFGIGTREYTKNQKGFNKDQGYLRCNYSGQYVYLTQGQNSHYFNVSQQLYYNQYQSSYLNTQYAQSYNPYIYQQQQSFTPPGQCQFEQEDKSASRKQEK